MVMQVYHMFSLGYCYVHNCLSTATFYQFLAMSEVTEFQTYIETYIDIGLFAKLTLL